MIMVGTGKYENGGEPYYGFIYQWHHTKTELYYIGQHKGFTNDGYIGSGVEFNYYYKLNPSYWERTILDFCSNAEELNMRERQCVGDNWQTDPTCLNGCAGGEAIKQVGGHNYTNNKDFSVAIYQLTLRSTKCSYFHDKLKNDENLMYLVSFRSPSGRLSSVCFYSPSQEWASRDVALLTRSGKILSVTRIKHEEPHYLIGVRASNSNQGNSRINFNKPVPRNFKEIGHIWSKQK